VSLAAIEKAMEAVIDTSRPAGDQRCGVVWHTQSSGKSLTMLFCVGAVMLSVAFRHENRDTESDLECLAKQPTQKNLWKIWKVRAA